MKYFIAIALIAAVASAGFNKPNPMSDEDAQLQEIIAAINSPSTDPATAALLEQMLQDLLNPTPEQPIHVGPEIIDHPISVGPEIIDFPIPDSALAPTPIAPAPVAPVAPTPASSPLVQIIVNVKQAEAAPVHPNPVDIVDVMPVLPVNVPEPEPVDVVDELPAPLEPVIVAPGIVSPVVVAPEILN